MTPGTEEAHVKDKIALEASLWSKTGTGQQRVSQGSLQLEGDVRPQQHQQLQFPRLKLQWGSEAANL